VRRLVAGDATVLVGRFAIGTTVSTDSSSAQLSSSSAPAWISAGERSWGDIKSAFSSGSIGLSNLAGWEFTSRWF
jgi:hypothetical protein